MARVLLNLTTLHGRVDVISFHVMACNVLCVCYRRQQHTLYWRLRNYVFVSTGVILYLQDAY